MHTAHTWHNGNETLAATENMDVESSVATELS